MRQYELQVLWMGLGTSRLGHSIMESFRALDFGGRNIRASGF